MNVNSDWLDSPVCHQTDRYVSCETFIISSSSFGNYFSFQLRLIKEIKDSNRTSYIFYFTRKFDKQKLD